MGDDNGDDFKDISFFYSEIAKNIFRESFPLVLLIYFSLCFYFFWITRHKKQINKNEFPKILRPYTHISRIRTDSNQKSWSTYQ